MSAIDEGKIYWRMLRDRLYVVVNNSILQTIALLSSVNPQAIALIELKYL